MAHGQSNLINSQMEQPENDVDVQEGKKVYLRRQVNVIDGIALTVGTIIGSGIFISPTGILRNTGSIGWSLIMWVFCGLVSTLGALSYAELATSFPVSGGDFSFLRIGFGPIPAFLRMYTSLVASSTGSNAVLALAASYYIVLPFFPDCQVSYRITTLMAASLLCNTANLGNAFSSPAQYQNFPLAVYSGLFAYSGWKGVMTVTEEIVHPSRTIPLSITISMFFVMVIYLLVNITYFLILSEDEILASKAIALDLGQRVMGQWWWTISLVVGLSILGSMNGEIFTMSRKLYVASREGHIPEIASMIHVDRKTPLPAAAIMVPITLMMLMSDDINSLINYLSFTSNLLTGMACLIIPYYRWKLPEMKRPFKVPLIVPVLFIICTFFVGCVSLYSSPVDCGIGLAITLTGLPVYMVGVWWQSKPSWVNKGLDEMTIFLQQLIYVVPQENIKSE